MERIPWEQYFMAQSVLLSMRSTCPRLSVGATIVRDHRVIAGGYNGSITGDAHCEDEGCYMRDGHCLRVVHAEMNALLQCAKFGISTDGASLYVTHFPCLQCMKSILQAGIRHIYYLHDYHNDDYAMKLVEQTGTTLHKVHVDDKYFRSLIAQLGETDEHIVELP